MKFYKLPNLLPEHNSNTTQNKMYPYGLYQKANPQPRHELGESTRDNPIYIFHKFMINSKHGNV